jgi:2'-5' RNA ligase
MRLFVAVWPPPEVVATLAALPRPEVDGVRWTSADQWHVTLRFLGNVAEPGPVTEALAPAVGRVPAVEAGLGPSLRRLGRSVLCVPVTGLEPMAEAVVEATRPLGDPAEDRPFRGHVTLARTRGRQRMPGALAGGAAAGRWPVDEVTLVRSRLSAGPARYEIVERYATSP